MSLSANGVTLFGSILTTAMAFLTVWSNRRSTRDTLEEQQYLTEATLNHQRALAHDERVWQERAALYVDLLEWLLYNVLELADLFESRLLLGEEAPEGPPAESINAHRINARVAAFASNRVREVDRSVRALLLEVVKANAQIRLTSPERPEPLNARRRHLLDKLNEQSTILLKLIRDELKITYGPEVARPEGSRHQDDASGD
ncbi:hypothetical protein amrb99_51630 [Actinomadura sp. RB99]|uniref:hypothetical protein n=1 Tax=Actinomadura sp. RB99 TaxID=2691577 RepID=UPI001686FB24|nr:hypothetical protein [Actinomadura sp. RB99]MBD2896219.1 hypothetical protein [Actinomadura sp. RB99]